jgi:hypothetical protein
MAETFTIDFFELAFLAEACIPPRPIARAMFWQNLTERYWVQMSEPQRAHIWNWLQKNPYYEESLKNEEDTKVFHARFDPDNQYMVHYNFQGVEDKRRVFKMGEKYYISRHTSIAEEYITSVEKLILKTEY